MLSIMMNYKLAASAALLYLIIPVSSYMHLSGPASGTPAIPYSNATKPVYSYSPLTSQESTNTNIPPPSGSPAIPYSNATKPVYNYSPLSSQESTSTNTPPSPLYGPYHFPNGTRPTYSHPTFRSWPTWRSSASLPTHSASHHGNMTTSTTPRATMAVPTNSSLSEYTATPLTTGISSVSTFSQTPTSPAAANATSMSLPYALNEANANANYLPCVPGTFICLSYNSFLTCGNNDGSDSDANEQNIYAYPRPVAIGMECLPNQSPAGGESQSYGQQDNTPAGYYRDDRIVRSQANGACTQEGALRCADGGGSFYICAQGAWIYMGSVAPGTTCQNGEIAAS